MSVPKAKKRGFIRFQPKNRRPPLTRERFEYWMDFLPKILKIGTEFEINLPDPGQILQNDNDKPCVHSEKPCVLDCSNLETCLTDRHPTFCMTRESGQFLGKAFACPAQGEDDVAACQTCPAWLLNCRGLNCAMHTPYCAICPSFQRKGEVIENGNILRDADTIRREVKDLLQPSGFVGQTGRHGVLEVKKDNSLINNGGIEVPTVGRRVHWESFYRMSKGIIEPIVERGGFVNERCGQHFHILAGYLHNLQGNNRAVSELEESLPEIVFANLHQLHRRYELAMFWIMSCGTEMAHLTRWARFRQSIFKYSALNSRMSKIQSELAESIVSLNSGPKGKYAAVAYHFCEFDEGGDLRTFHIENRIADGALSATVVTAWAMLLYALVLKAVRLSQYGIMEIGDAEYRAAIEAIQPHLIDGGMRDWGDNRKADTSGLVRYIPWLQENAKELVTFLKPELNNMGPAYDVLMSLAGRPCALRLVDGDTWQKIEQDLQGEPNPKPHRDSEEEVREIVDLSGIVDCANLNVWIEEVAANLGRPPAQIEEVVSYMTGSGHYRWSEPIGALITT